MLTVQDQILHCIRSTGRGKVFTSKDFLDIDQAFSRLARGEEIQRLGRSTVDSQAISRLRRALSPQQKGELLRDARYTTDWIAEVVRQVAAEKPESVAHG